MKKIYSANPKKCRFLIFLIGIFLSLSPRLLFGQTTVTFPATTTWTCPVGVTSITVECWGGGGAGGGATGNPAAGGGGGGGSYVKNTAIPVTPGTIYTVTVAASVTGTTAAGANGNPSWFGTITTILATGGNGGALAASNNQTAAGGIALTTGNVGATAPFSYYGGAGGTGGANGASGGGGGSSAGTGSNGNNATGVTGGTAPTGGFAGVNGTTTSGDGADNTNIGGGGAGAHAGNTTDRNGGNGGPGQVKITYTQLTYKSQIISVSAASTAPWCPGETRNVQVTIKNTGTATWTDGTGGTPVINVGVKWNINGLNWADYYVRVSAANLAPGATTTYTLPLTASNNTGSGYTTPLASGTNNLIFDVVYEGISWFGDNAGGVGPGNSKFTTPNVTINAVPTVTNSPLTQTICSGGNTTLVTLTGSVGGTTFSWTATATAGVSGFTASGTSTIPIQTISTTGTTQGTVTYAITPTAGGCPGAVTNYTVLVNPKPTITNSPLTQTICSGGSTSLVTLTSNVTGATFAWTATATAGVSGFTASGTGTIPVQTISTTGTTQGTVTYAITPTATGCPGAVTNYTVLVNPKPIVTNSPLTQTICSGGSTSLVTLTSNVGGATFAWTATATAGVSGFTASGTGTIPVQTISTTGTTQGTVTYAITPTATGCPGAVTNYTVLVNPNPNVTNSPLTQTICSGGSTSLVTLTSNLTGTTFAWTATATAGVSGFTVSGTGTIPAQTISTTGTTQGTVTYAITPTATGCPGSVTNYTVLVNPNPNVTNSPLTQTICSGGSTTLVTLTSDVSGATFAWTATAIAGISGFTASGTGTIPVQTISSTLTTTGTVTYAITPTASGCPGAVTNYTVVVNPAPVANAGGATAAICQGGTTAALGGSFNGGATGAIWDDGGAGGTFANNTGTTPGTATYTASATAPASVTLTLTTSGGPCGTTSDSKTLTVYQSVVIATNPSPATQTVCATSNVTYTVGATGTGLTYQWFLDGNPISNGGNISGATTASLLITGVALSDDGDYTVQVSGTAPCSPAISVLVHLDVDQRATFTAQPVTPQTICQGNAYTISATANGTVVTSVWNHNGTFYANASVSGNVYSLTIPAVAPADAGNYQLVLDDGTTGCSASNSAIAVLNVSVTSVGGAVGSDATVCSGTNSGTLTLTGKTGNVVRWESSVDGGTSWTPIANTTTSQAYTNLTQTTLYRAVVQSGVCPIDNSTPATITVNPIPNAVATPSSQPICSGNAITTIALTGGVTGTTFSWTRDNTGSVTGIAASGNGDINGTLTNLTTAPVTVSFTITPTANSCVGTPITATVTVNPLPSVANTFTNPTYCNGAAGAAVAFTSNVASGVTYNWTSTFDVGFGTSGTGNITAYTATNATNTAVTTTVTVTATANGCSGSSKTYTVTVNPTSNVINTFSSPTYCNGAAGAAVAFTSNVAGATFTWTSTANVGFGLSGSGTIAAYTATNATNLPVTATVTVIATNAGCAGPSSSYTVTVNPTSNVTNTFTSPVYCNGAAGAAVAFTSNVASGVTYNWTSTFDVGFGTSGTGTIAAYTATNATNAAVTTTVTVTATANGCTGPSKTYTVKVNPTSNVTNAFSSPTYCNGAAGAAVNFTSNVTGATFTWSTGGINVGFGTSGSGTIAAYTATNATNLPVTATVTVIATNAGCAGPSSSYTVTVNPTSNVTNTFTSPVYCNGAAGAAVAFTSNVASGVTYNWTSTFDVGFGTSGTGTIAAYTATNATNAAVTTTVTVTATANGCTGPSKTYTVKVNPTSNVTNAFSSPTYCNGAVGAAVNFTSNVTGATFTWSTGGINVGFGTSGSGTIAAYTATNATNLPVTATVTVIATNAGCAGPSSSYTVTVNPTSNVTNTFTSPVYCNGAAGAAVAFTSNVASGVTYNWTSTFDVGFGTSGTGTIAAYTATNATNAAVTTTVTVTATANGCTGPSKTYTVKVNPTSNVTNAFSSPTYCNGAAGAAVNFTSNVTGATFTWSTGGINVGFGTSGSGTIAAYTATNATNLPVTATVTVIATNAGCAGPSSSYTVTVNPTSNVTNTFTSPVYCNGAAGAAVAFTSNVGSGVTYNWTSTFDVGFGTSGTGTIAAYTATNAGTAAKVATVTVIATANGCNGPSKTFTVTVNPTPNSIATPASQTRCEGNAITTIVLSTSATPSASTTYTWTRDNTASVNGTGSFAVASGSGNITGTPNLPGSTPVTVTFTITPSFSGCPGTTTTATVLVNPLPTASAITGPNNTVCIGKQITLTGNGSGIGTLIYHWTSSNPAAASVNASTSSTVIVTGAGVGNTNISYTVSDANGCSSSASSSFQVSVTQPIAGAITQASGLSTVCVNSTLALTSNASGGQAPLIITWASSDNTIATVSNTGVVTGIAAGTVNITYTVTDANGCPTPSAAYPVTVNAIPTGTLVATENSGIANNDGIICTGATVTFTATPGYGAYNFKVNGTSVQSGTLNHYSSSTLTNGASITVDVANSLNCGATFGPVVITVNTLPSPTLSASKNPLCQGDNVTFTAGGGTSYNFKINGSSVQNGATTTYSTTALNNGDNVTVDVTNANGCTATSTAIVMVVNALPSGTLSASATTICAGTNVTFTASPAGLTSYQFYVNGISVQGPGASNTYSSATLTNGSVVTVAATNAAGCSKTFAGVLINVNALPTGSITTAENSGTPNDNTICTGAPVTFTASPGFTNYKFLLNGIGAALQNGSSNVYTSTTLNNNDFITAVVTNTNGCIATFISAAITVIAPPTGSLTASATTICAGDNVVFTATAGFTNYNFKVNGTPVQNGASNTYSTTSLANGAIVTVDVTNSNSCLSTFGPVTMTVNALPTGTLVAVENSGLTPNDGIICTGASVVFTAPAGFTNYNFSLNGTNVQNGASNTYTNNTLNNGDVVTVAVTNGPGCIGLLNAITITVNPLPVVAAITGTTTVCVNSTTTLADATSGGVWSSSDNSIATVNASGVVTGVAAGTVAINYTVTDANGCSTIATASVTVNALPTVSPIIGTFSVCVGSTTQLSDATAPGTWSSLNTAVATVDGTGLVTGVTSGSVTIDYSVTNANGCTTVVTALIAVNNVPVVAAITGTLSVCVNSTTTLSDATSGGLWSSSNTAVATVNGSGVVTGISGGTSVISYSVTNANGCNTTVTTTVTVNPLPVPTLSGPNLICEGDTDTYVTETGGGIHNYVWNHANGTVFSGGTAADNTITIIWGAGTKSVSVNYTDANGCSGSVSTTVINAPGTSPTITGPATVCQNSTGNTYTTETGESDYTWTFSAGASVTAGGGAGDDFITITWTGSGSQSVTVNYSNAGHCNAPTPTSYGVTVNPAPTVVITNPAAVCSPATVDLTITTVTAGSTAGLTFTYYTDAAGTIVYPTPTNAGAGTYYIKGTTSAGCYDIEPVTVTVNPTPTVVINPPAAVCSPSTVDITAPAITSGSTAGLTFTYYTNAAGTIVFSTPTTAGAGTYYIKGTTAAGCSDIKPVTVTVNPTPTVVITNPAPVCSPSTVDLTAGSVTAGSTSGLTFTYYTDAAGTIVYTTPTTASAGIYYIKGATGAGCSSIKPVTVTVNPTPTVVINPPAAVCSPATVDITAAAITSGSTAGLTFTYYTDAAGTIVFTTPTTAGAGTYYIKGTTAAGCSNIKPVTVTVNPTPTVVITNPAPVCSPATVNITLPAVTAGSTAGLTYTYFTDAAGTIVYSTPTTAGSGTYYIKGKTAAGCFDIKPVVVTVNPLPTATISGTVSVCQSAPAPNITFTGANGTAPYTFTYKINAGGNLTVTSVGNVATVSAPTTTVGTFTYTLISVKDASSTTCSQNQGGTAVVTVIALPTISVLPVSATFCQAVIQPLVATSTGSPVTQTATFASGTINLAIPDFTLLFGFFPNPGEANTPITVSGIPAGAVISNVSIILNVTHPNDGDLNFNIKAPNGNILNLVNREGGTGNNFTNTTVSMTGGVAFPTGVAPFSATYNPDGSIGVGPGGNTSNVNNFSNLTSVPNGTWRLYAEDDAANNAGTINSWSVVIQYSIPASNPVNWSPITDLYTDAGATTPYAGQSLTTVYAKPSTGGTKVYTATATNAAGCTNTAQSTLTINLGPVVTVTADYCAVSGKVKLTASPSSGVSYLWSTGETTSSILVDEAGTYSVTATSGSGCKGSGTITVANELVVNGDFESGDIGFTTAYISHTGSYYTGGATTGLYPEGYYAVDTSAYSGYPSAPIGYHPSFHGKDHTTGHGKFMLVNGSTALRNIWQETVTVLPNTTYYFSGWGMNLNPGSPAQLQFSVNGVQAGTVGDLSTAPMPTTEGQVNQANWIRFYGTWTSGPAVTTAVINILNLNTIAGGNDFGLDDISFGTLSTFVELESAPGTDSQTVCVNAPVTPIVYSVGSTASGPTITGLPPGMDTTFNGVLFTITGSPTAPGDYAYTVTTTGTCNPSSATGVIHVQAQKITLTSGTSAPTVCINTPVNIGYTLSGTATGATATGLPTGVNLTVTGTAVSITGSPSVAGTFSYTITTSGGCTPVTATGTITVNAQTITLNSANNIQTVCINSPSFVNITYTVGGTATGASVTGLPAGLGGTYNSGFFVISGSPTVSGTFNYTITTSPATGACAVATATGTITVTPAASLTLTSGASSNVQSLCNGSAMTTPVTYTVNNGTGATVSGLPTGISGTYAGGVFTISGTPTVSGTFNYTVTTSGGCGFGTATGTLTVNTPITLTSGSASPSVCINANLLPAIVYTLGGGGTSATVSGLPTGVGFTITGATLTISGVPSVSGSFPYVVTTSGTCANSTANGTITVQPLAVGGSLTNVAICSGGSGSLTLTGQVGTIVRWEKSIDGGTTWTPIANITITQTYTGVTVPTLYRVVVGNSCGNVTSTVALVAIHNYWTGASGTDWNTAANWSDNLVPSMICPDVYIPNTPNKPILNPGAVATIGNLNIFAGAVLTVTGTGHIQIGGVISNSGTFDVTNGTLEFNGTSQSISGSILKNRSVKDLIVTSGGTGLTVSNTVGDTLNIMDALTFGNTTSDLTTGGNITLKSTISATASLGVLAAGNTISGDVTVERYIATGIGSAPNHGKSWQLLGIPTQGQTINQAWQEGATASDVAFPIAPSAGNPHAGFGAMLTSDVAGTAQGFDAQTVAGTGASIKVYVNATGGYNGPANTTATPIYNQKGYFVFVRGDRSITGAFTAAVPTTLRTKGTLFTPANKPDTTLVINGKFESVGNPYASAIDVRQIGRSGGATEFFQIWDPRLGSQNGYGAFQTFTRIGSDYYAVPGGTANYPGFPTPNDYIQSGQAFFVQATGSDGKVYFNESAKAGGSILFTTPNSIPPVQHMLSSTLLAVNPDGSTSTADGVLSSFDDTYSNAVDGMDARKSVNSSENLSIKTAGKLLAVERRQPITQQDTIFLNITGERAQPYRFHFAADNLDPSIQGYLVDSYAKTRTPLNMTGTTDVNFTVANVTGSNAANRFMIVFEPLKALPVTFTSITAYKQDKNIDVQWRVDNEMNIKQYEVEKSTDGNQFTSIAVQKPTANNGGSAVYVVADANPVEGNNYYRVKSVDVNGKISYTSVVKVLTGSLKQDITIYPNPITDGMIHLQLMNEPEGKYHIRLLNKLGQLILQQQVTHAGGNATELIKWDFNLAHGLYQLEVTKPDGTVKDINVLY